LEWVRKLLLTTYLKTYLQFCPDIKKSLTCWQAVMAANFLSDVSVPGEEELRAIVTRGLVGSGATHKAMDPAAPEGKQRG